MFGDVVGFGLLQDRKSSKKIFIDIRIFIDIDVAMVVWV